jgi:hypothetical protein
MLKHAASGGEIQGNLLEVGPQHGLFLQFMCENPYFRENVSAAGIEPNPYARARMPLHARMRTAEMSVEDFAKTHPQRHGKQHIIIAKNILDAPDVVSESQRREMLRAMSRLAAPGGKVFLQTTNLRTLPAAEHLRKNDLREIDRLDKPHFEFIRVLEKK